MLSEPETSKREVTTYLYSATDSKLRRAKHWHKFKYNCIKLVYQSFDTLLNSLQSAHTWLHAKASAGNKGKGPNSYLHNCIREAERAWDSENESRLGSNWTTWRVTCSFAASYACSFRISGFSAQLKEILSILAMQSISTIFFQC